MTKGLYVPGTPNGTGVANHDAFVLSQPGYTFWAAEGYQTFHRRNCPELASVTNLHGYARCSDAQRFGLTPCKLCKPTPKNDIIASVPIYQRQRCHERLEQIDALCCPYGWKYYHDEHDYFIETPVGKWKMVLGTYPVEVFHINKAYIRPLVYTRTTKKCIWTWKIFSLRF